MAFNGKRRTPKEKKEAEREAINGLHLAFHKKPQPDCEWCIYDNASLDPSGRIETGYDMQEGY